MNVLIIDWMNLVKRYIHSKGLAELEVGEVTKELTYYILNRLDKIFFTTKPDMIFICCDNGFNKRAAGLVAGYKANRKKFKSLTEEERERSYVNYLKMLAKSLPTAYIEIKDVEADMTIRCIVNSLKQIDPTIKFTIASNDSDMLQLIDDNVRIYHWTKDFININNWLEKSLKTEFYFNPRNYALAKSIVGDMSDNVKGAPGIGWKKMYILFDALHNHYGKDYVAETVYNLIESTENMFKTIDIKQQKSLGKILSIIKENAKIIHTNMFVIDMNMIETPFLFKIIEEIKRSISVFSKSKFHRRIIIDLLKLNYEGELDIDDEEILRKNSKALLSLMNIHKRTVYTSNLLLKRLEK